MYEDLGMNDKVNDKNFNYGFEFQWPKYVDTHQVICQASSRNMPILLFCNSYCDYFAKLHN